MVVNWGARGRGRRRIEDVGRRLGLGAEGGFDVENFLGKKDGREQMPQRKTAVLERGGASFRPPAFPNVAQWATGPRDARPRGAWRGSLGREEPSWMSCDVISGTVDLRHSGCQPASSRPKETVRLKNHRQGCDFAAPISWCFFLFLFVFHSHLLSTFWSTKKKIGSDHDQQWQSSNHFSRYAHPVNQSRLAESGLRTGGRQLNSYLNERL